MKKFLTVLSYILVAMAAAVLTLAISMPRHSTSISKLDHLSQLIQAVFIEEPDVAAMEDAAAAAMVDSLGDRWSYYMNKEDYAEYVMQMANAYVGIGVTVTQEEDGYVHVLRVEVGSPALDAGMKAGDVIVAVEGQDIGGMTLDEVKNKIRGKEGTPVKLTVRRGEESLELTIIRGKIQVAVAKGEMLEDGIGLVQIVNFDGRCSEETIAIVEDLLAQGAQKLIFDVRYNPGGYQVELVKILDYLLPEGPLFRSVNYAGEEKVDHSDARCLEIPMAVLINGDSYSAAEFFAAALSEYDAAVTVGEPTTGKGYFQNAFQLVDGSAAVISIGKYTTPKGVSLADVGLTPDITVNVDEEQYLEIYYGNVAPMEDPQILAAIEALKAG